MDTMRLSSSGFCPFLHSRPSFSIRRVFASKLCPDRIIQPQPVSLVKPCVSPRFRSRTDSVILENAAGSVDFGIAGKPDLYVKHSFDSKSSRNAVGHPSSEVLSPAWLASMNDMSSASFVAGGTDDSEVGDDDFGALFSEALV